MKIILPENISEITLDQFQRYYKLSQREDLDELDFNKRKIEIFSKIPFQKVGNIKQSDYDFIIGQIDKALNVNCEFVDRFKMNGIEFGFIPNFDEMTVNELGDIREYQDKEDELHKLMAILFRPVSGKDLLGNYTIEDYNGTAKYSELMKQTPMHIVNGALGFFLSLHNELEIAIQKSMVEALTKGAAV